ncbi:MAG: histidinol-phosphate aminotransferase family protein [Gemmatimonadaceae bacterium]|nr:histidinol-phosphate aminotransferase family protein [Gemmatimonadaceae bacterium]
MPRLRTALADIGPAVHGGRHGASDDASNIIDFSVCLNAHGPAPEVVSAIAACVVDEYPDRSSTRERALAAAWYQRPIDEIVLGAGSAELIQATCLAYLEPDRAALLLRPCFGEYERAARLTGASVRSVWSVKDLLAMITADVHVVFVASPTSPYGEQLPLSSIQAIAEACRTADALLVLDQAYDAFAARPHGTPVLAGHDHVLHLRSLTKDHALAGVRVAFAVCPPEVAQAIEQVRVPWIASAPTQAAASALMTDTAMRHAAQTIESIRAEAGRITSALNELEIVVEPTDTHYQLIGCHDAARLRATLLSQHGILVRDTTSFGLPQHVRVAARTPLDNDALLHAMRAHRSLFRTTP